MRGTSPEMPGRGLMHRRKPAVRIPQRRMMSRIQQIMRLLNENRAENAF